MIIEIILITVLSFVGNIIGTVSGFGVGTIITPILLFMLPYPVTIFLVCILHFIHDIFKLFFFKSGIDWQLFWHFGMPSIIAAALGALLVGTAQSDILAALLGLFLIVVVVMMTLFPRVQLPKTITSGVVGGLISGFLAGIFGVRGAVRSLFFVAMEVDKMSLIGTTGLISFFIDATRLGVYYWDGIKLDIGFYWGMLLFVPASFLGVYVGKGVVHYVSQKTFNRIVSFFLALVGVKLLLTPWLG